MFSLLLLLFFLFFAILSLSYGSSARLVPLLLGLSGSILGIVSLLFSFSPRFAEMLSFLKKEELLMHNNIDKSGKGQDNLSMNKEKWIKFLRIIGWMIVFLLLIKYTHTIFAVIVFVFFLIAFEAMENWKRSLKISLGAGFFMYVLFVVFLRAL